MSVGELLLKPTVDHSKRRTRPHGKTFLGEVGIIAQLVQGDPECRALQLRSCGRPQESNDPSFCSVMPPSPRSLFGLPLKPCFPSQVTASLGSYTPEPNPAGQT